MATRSARTPSRARRIGSYLVSLAVHGSVLVAVGPCIPAVPTALRVQRIPPVTAPPSTAADRLEARERGESAEGPRDAASDRALASETPSGTDRDRDRDRDRSAKPASEPIPDPEFEFASEPVPEPDPEEAPARVVHTSEAGQRPEQADAQSAHDQDAVERSAPVLSPDEGPTSAAQQEAAARRLERGQTGKRAQSEAGGARPTAPASQTAAPQRASTSPPDALPEGEDPSWWAPIATRIPPRPSAETDPAEHEVPEPDTDAEDPVQADVTDHSKELPETLAVADRDLGVDVGAGAVDQGADATEVGEEEAPEPVDEDGVADARIDGEAQEGMDPTLESRKAPSASHQTVVDGPEADQATVAALGTDWGAWIQEVDTVVRKRWASRELPVHLQGIGLRGEATVRFRIQPNGRTGSVELVKKSGNEWLDAYALDAIPPRVPRMTKDLEPRAVEHEITFRYR